MAEEPKQTYTVTLCVGGCDWERVADTLIERAEHIREHGPECDLVWGGARTHGYVSIKHRDVSREQYEAESMQWHFIHKGPGEARDG